MTLSKHAELLAFAATATLGAAKSP